MDLLSLFALSFGSALVGFIILYLLLDIRSEWEIFHDGEQVGLVIFFALGIIEVSLIGSVIQSRIELEIANNQDILYKKTNDDVLTGDDFGFFIKNKVDFGFYTPMWHACLYCHVDAYYLLKKYGSDLHQIDYQERNLLYIVAYDNKINPKMHWEYIKKDIYDLDKIFDLDNKMNDCLAIGLDLYQNGVDPLVPDICGSTPYNNASDSIGYRRLFNTKLVTALKAHLGMDEV